NGDGNFDIVVADNVNDTFHMFLGNGDGTFQSSTSYASNGSYRLGIGDFNGDQVTDIAVSDYTSGAVDIFLVHPKSSLLLERFDISTRQRALEALEGLGNTLTRINIATGNIGGHRSRLDLATSNLRSSKLRFEESYSRLVDADIAEETSHLVKLQISQQVGASIAAQANQQKTLALRLLS
ncbi:MAG: VCBS repeat-containing protein, partial [Bdellovibrionales bacterium]|nr:VCBS repeat-containing protein [Bdellovibrionales bacterium]